MWMCVLVGVQAFMSVVDDVMEFGWEFVDPTTLNFTMIVRNKVVQSRRLVRIWLRSDDDQNRHDR